MFRKRRHCQIKPHLIVERDSLIVNRNRKAKLSLNYEWLPVYEMSSAYSDTCAGVGDLVKELEEYMPQFNVSTEDLQELCQTFVTQFYECVFNKFFCDRHLIEVVNNIRNSDNYGGVHQLKFEATGGREPSNNYIFTLVNDLKYVSNKIQRSPI